MKKNLPYIAGVVALIVLAVLVISSTKKLPRRMDETITLKHLDKIPYGTAAAKALLPSLFKNAKIYADNKSPLYWDSIQPTSYNQAVILMAKYFYPEHYQLQRLADFASNGNYVFIISNSFSSDAQEYFNFSYSENSFDELVNNKEDSLAVKLEKPSFTSDSTFIYPGKKFKSWFTELDTNRVIVLGRDENNEPNFIRLNRGGGAIFIHTA